MVAAVTNNVIIPAHCNLGEVTLTNLNETCLQLTAGESCTLTPKLLDRNSVQITLALESKDNSGGTQNFSVTQVIARSGKLLAGAVGDLNLSFTPRVSVRE